MGRTPLSVLAAGVAIGIAAGCASPVAGLWPPGPGAPAHGIVVSVDTWHAMIALPRTPRAEPAPPVASFEEWGYAERGWYLEGRQGAGGVLRAMLWPSPGVVEVAVTRMLWAERTPDPPAVAIRFDLTEAGLLRLREHLRRTVAGAGPVAVLGESRFHAARGDYHLFHTCHQYAARALRETGLPVSPGLALSRATLVAQLRRASRMQDAAKCTGRGGQREASPRVQCPPVR